MSTSFLEFMTLLFMISHFSLKNNLSTKNGVLYSVYSLKGNAIYYLDFTIQNGILKCLYFLYLGHLTLRIF